jgi:hypothetical protein
VEYIDCTNYIDNNRRDSFQKERVMGFWIASDEFQQSVVVCWYRSSFTFCNERMGLWCSQLEKAEDVIEPAGPGQ